MNNDNMRGLFFIMKGRYIKGLSPQFKNDVSGDTMYIGGYDPFNSHTENWYMLMDCKTFHCIACGSDLDKVLKGVYTVIKRHKGVAKKYFKRVSDTTSDDYYETHYLGQSPLTHDQRVKKAEGRCPRVSPVMRCLYEKVFEEYGDYYSDQIEEMEDLAYSELVDERPVNKNQKLMAKTKKSVGKMVMTPKEEKVLVTQPTLVKPKARLGIKKLQMV